MDRVAERDLDELWRRVVASWDDAEAHADFIEQCRAERQLGTAAARYREVIQRGTAYRHDELRVESARKRLMGLTALALADLQALRHEPVTPRPIVRLFARVGLLVLALAAIAFAALSVLTR